MNIKTHSFFLPTATLALLLGFIGFMGLNSLLAEPEGYSQQLTDCQTMIVTASQYTEFLNATAKADPHNLYDFSMAADPSGTIIIRSGKPGHYYYSVSSSGQDCEISYVNEASAMRYCNWIENGQPVGNQGPETTEDGVYALDTLDIRSEDIADVFSKIRASKNPNATYYITDITRDDKTETDLSLKSNKKGFLMKVSLPSILTFALPSASSASSQISTPSIKEIGEVIGFIGLAAFGHELMMSRSGMTERPDTRIQNSSTSRINEREANDTSATSSSKYFKTHATEHLKIAAKIQPKTIGLEADHPWMKAYDHSSTVASVYSNAAQDIISGGKAVENHHLFGTASAQKEISDYLIKAAKCHEKAIQAKNEGNTQVASLYDGAYFLYVQAAETRKPRKQKTKKESLSLAGEAKQKELDAERVLQTLSLNTPLAGTLVTPKKRPSIDSATMTTKESSPKSTSSDEAKGNLFPSPSAKTEALAKAAQDLKSAAKYEKDVDQAVSNISKMLDTENCKEAFDKMDALMDQRVAADIAANSALIAAKNIEDRLIHFQKLSEENLITEESSLNDSLLFIAADLSLAAIKKTTEQVRSVALSIMNEPKYQGAIANEALAPLQTINDADFNDILTTKQPAIVAESTFSMFAAKQEAFEANFPTLVAKQEALNRAAQRAEAAFQYAEATIDALNDVFEIFFFCNDYPTTEQRLAKPCHHLADTRSIANAAAENIREHLAALERLPELEKNTGVKESSYDDVKLLIAVDLAVDAVEKAAQATQIVAKDIIKNNEYDRWEWEEIRTQALTDLEEAEKAFKEAIQCNNAANEEKTSKSPIDITAPLSYKNEGESSYEEDLYEDLDNIPPSDGGSYLREYTSPSPEAPRDEIVSPNYLRKNSFG
ncbi:MAG: hypothetical protein ACH346_04970 [Chthoniobacterales bacterium]